jgi:hypothetical protein
MAAERYRDLQGRSLLETGVVQPNAGDATARLSQVFKNFESEAWDRTGVLRAQKGQQEGADAGARGQPQLRTGLKATTAYGQAYNNAATRSYLVKAEADAEETAARLEVDSGTDPERFRATFGKVRDEVLKTSEPTLRAALGELYNQRLGAGLQRIEYARAREVRAEQRATTSEGIGRAIDRIGQLRAEAIPGGVTGLLVPGNIDLQNRPRVLNPNGSVSTVLSMSIGTEQGEVLIPRVSESGKILTPQQAIEQYRRTGKHLGIFDSPQKATEYAGSLHTSQAAMLDADEEEVKMSLLIDGALADGTLSRTEAESLKLDAHRGILKKTITARFAREFDSPYGDPIGFIEHLREANKTSEALPPEEEAKLQDELMAELRERNALRAARESSLMDGLRLRWLQGDRVATAAMLSGTLTQRQLLQMVESNQLDPSDARTLLNELQTGDTFKSDPRELFNVETNLLSLDEKEIATNRALSWADRSRLISKRRDESAGWKATQQAREGADRIDRALKIAPGVMRAALSPEEAEQRDQALTEWYQLVDALPPEERQLKAIELADQVTSKVIKRNASSEVEKIQGRIQDLKREFPDPSALSEEGRKVYEDRLKRQQDRLREAEQQAK